MERFHCLKFLSSVIHSPTSTSLTPGVFLSLNKSEWIPLDPGLHLDLDLGGSLILSPPSPLLFLRNSFLSLPRPVDFPLPSDVSPLPSVVRDVVRRFHLDSGNPIFTEDDRGRVRNFTKGTLVLRGDLLGLGRDKRFTVLSKKIGLSRQESSADGPDLPGASLLSPSVTLPCLIPTVLRRSDPEWGEKTGGGSGRREERVEARSGRRVTAGICEWCGEKLDTNEWSDTRFDTEGKTY